MGKTFLFLMIALLFAPVAAWAEAPATIKIDTATCSLTGTGSQAWEFGSWAVQELHLAGAECAFIYEDEIEGGYSRSSCRVPSTWGIVSVYKAGVLQWTDPESKETRSISATDADFPCILIKQGNIFLDMQNSPEKK